MVIFLYIVFGVSVLAVVGFILAIVQEEMVTPKERREKMEADMCLNLWRNK